MTDFLNACWFRAASGGTGTFTVSSAITGYMTPAQADAVDGNSYRYRAESDDLSQWEIGTGTYTASGTTLTRTVLKSSNANAAVNFSAAPKVAITSFAQDMVPVVLARYDFGTTPAPSITFPYDVGRFHTIELLARGLRVDVADFVESDTIEGLRFVVFDDAENELVTINLNGIMYADLFSGQVNEFAPVAGRIAVTSQGRSVEVALPELRREYYLDGTFVETDSASGGSAEDLPSVYSDLEIVCEPNFTAPIDFVAGTITIIGWPA